MPRPPVALPCRSCGGLRTRIIEQDPDPDYRRGATVWRVRLCLDCEAITGTAEVPVALEVVRDRLNALARERYYDRRAVLTSPA
jgi:hypothetical protein